ncbi:MAG: HEAT repeat domain-containing protein [Nitrospirota bacterium]
MWWPPTNVYTVLLGIITAVAVLVVVCGVAVAIRRAFKQRRYRTRDQLRAHYAPIVAALRPGDEPPESLDQPNNSPAWEVIGAELREAIERAASVQEREFLSGVCGRLGYVEAHIRRLSDGRPGARALAADHLGAMRHRTAVPALARALDDSDLDVRTVSARALGMIGGEDALGHLVHRLLSASPDEPEISFRVIKSVLMAGGPSVVAPLENGLLHPVWRIRSAVIDILGQVGAAETAPRLVELLSDPEPDVRAKVARVLGQLGHGPAVPTLQTALGDPAWVVRLQATRSLGLLGGAATSALQDRLLDTQWHVRAAAAEALRRSGSDALWSIWSTLSDCRDRYAREQLFEELQRSSLLQKYIGLLESHRVEERTRSETVVQDCLREGVTSLIIHSLKTHPSADVRRRLLDLLTPYRQPEIIAAIEEVKASDPDHGLRRLAQAVLDGATVSAQSQRSNGHVV